jgi:puromycin-sensitive aminopeptidase
MNASNSTAATESDTRLSPSVVPSYYDFTIEPDIEKRTFAGVQKTTIDVTEATDRLVINSADMRIHEAILTDSSGTQMMAHVDHDEAKERATLKFDGQIGTGTWDLGLKYSGVLNDKLRGFHACQYKNSAGKDALLATTKFEPCDARRAFPCFDEPAMKARFKISLLIDEGLQGVSNGRLLKTTKVANGKKLLEFAPTMRLPTYVVAYRVGNFVSTKPVMVRGKELRVWCVPGKEHLSEFALTVAKFGLEFFSQWFKEPYMGDKMDLMAIPEFASGAMEDFACIAFREPNLLVDLNTASFAELVRVAEVILHELAHMWFGDFVTMKWWNGLWLNEAFATFLALVALAALKPEWRTWESFNLDRANAMKVDGLVSTRAIEFPVNYPEEARGMFDVLTYEKGCAILRMLQLFLGEEAFRSGLVNYVHKHQHGNADGPDLWQAIEEMTKRFSETVTVTDMMNSWIFQPGYPIIEVSESEVKGSVTFKQRIFRYLKTDDEPKTLWHVPLHVRATIRGDDGKPETVEKVFLLSEAEETFYIGEGLSNLVVNAGGHGFYRVHLSDDLQGKLLSDTSGLNASERFNLVNDAWATVLTGNTSAKDYWDMVALLTGPRGESDLTVMSAVISSFNNWRTAIDNCTCWRPGMQQVVSSSMTVLAERVLVPVYDRIGHRPVTGESPQQGQLRGKLMTVLGEIQYQPVVDDCRQLFAAWKNDRSAVDNNMIGAVINTMAVTGDESVYEEFLALKKAAKTPQEETRFTMSLASFRDAKLADRTMKACLNLDGAIKKSDAFLVMNAMLANTAVLGPDHEDKRPVALMPDGSEIIHPLTVARRTWNFIKDNWDTFVERYPMQGVSRMASGVSSLLFAELRKDVADFFATRKVAGGEKAVKQAMEQAQVSFQIITGQKNSINEFFTAGGARLRSCSSKDKD